MAGGRDKTSSTHQVSPSAFDTIDFYPSDILHPAAWAAMALSKPSSNASDMVLMPAEQLHIRALLQTNRALIFIAYFNTLFCVRRPSKVANASVNDCFFFPLDFHDFLILFRHTVGGTRKEASPAEATKESNEDSGSNDGRDDYEDGKDVG